MTLGAFICGLPISTVCTLTAVKFGVKIRLRSVGAFGLSVLKLPLGLSQRSIRNKKLHSYPKGPVIIFDSEGVGDFFKGSHALQEERNGKSRCQLIVVRIIYF